MRRLTGRLDLAEEGVNDVTIVVWKNGECFDWRSKVSTWIMAIACQSAEVARHIATLVVPVQSDFEVSAGHLEASASEGSDGIDRREVVRPIGKSARSGHP